MKILLHLLNHTEGLIRQAVDLLAGRIDAPDMLRPEVIHKRQNTDEENDRRCGIDSESRRPAAQARPDLGGLQHE